MFEYYVYYLADELRTNTGLIALLSILLTGFVNMAIQHFSRSLELKKHKQQLLFEKKYNAYAKFFEYFDEYCKIAQDYLIAIKQFNDETPMDEDEFEKAKSKLLITWEKFIQIKSYLDMPGTELLIFFSCNKKIESKVLEIRQSEDSIINPNNLLAIERPKIEKQIKSLSELFQLLKEDLGLEKI